MSQPGMMDKEDPARRTEDAVVMRSPSCHFYNFTYLAGRGLSPHSWWKSIADAIEAPFVCLQGSLCPGKQTCLFQVTVISLTEDFGEWSQLSPVHVAEGECWRISVPPGTWWMKNPAP